MQRSADPAAASAILRSVSDLPFRLDPGPAALLAAALDQERKIDRALETLGPIADRDVVLIGAGSDEAARRASGGARVTRVESLLGDDARGLPDASCDAIATAWSGFRGVDPADLAAADRLLRPGGRLLVVHDYGRDDVSRLHGDRPEYGSWSKRNGPFLANGFRVRVIHCFWTFDTIEDARTFLGQAFGADGDAVGEGLKRARLSYNVAVYHRTRGGASGEGEPAGADGAAPAPTVTF